MAWLFGLFRIGPAARLRRDRRDQAQERLLDGMAERIAALEIALLREQRQTRHQALRAGEAEETIIRLQSTLDRLRREGREPGRESGIGVPAHLFAKHAR